MSSDNNHLPRIKKVFNQVFSIDEDKVTQETSIGNTQEWDSLQHIQLVMAIEGEFGIKLEMNEIVEIQSVDKIISLLNEKV